jgi:hypothetical protein
VAWKWEVLLKQRLAITAMTIRFAMKKAAALAGQRLFLQLVANQGFEPRTCGL